MPVKSTPCAGLFACSISASKSIFFHRSGWYREDSIVQQTALDAVPDGLKSPLAFTPLMMPLLYIQMIQSS